jgi:membrane protein implicated in regulation of membrane protease activity
LIVVRVFIFVLYILCYRMCSQLWVLGSCGDGLLFLQWPCKLVVFLFFAPCSCSLVVIWFFRTKTRSGTNNKANTNQQYNI